MRGGLKKCFFMLHLVLVWRNRINWRSGWGLGLLEGVMGRVFEILRFTNRRNTLGRMAVILIAGLTSACETGFDDSGNATVQFMEIRDQLPRIGPRYAWICGAAHSNALILFAGESFTIGHLSAQGNNLGLNIIVIFSEASNCAIYVETNISPNDYVQKFLFQELTHGGPAVTYNTRPIIAKFVRDNCLLQRQSTSTALRHLDCNLAERDPIEIFLSMPVSGFLTTDPQNPAGIGLSDYIVLYQSEAFLVSGIGE